MTPEERDELVALVEALPDERREALLFTLRRGRNAALRRPLSSLGPIPAAEAEAILQAIMDDREQINVRDW